MSQTLCKVLCLAHEKFILRIVSSILHKEVNAKALEEFVEDYHLFPLAGQLSLCVS